MQIPIPESSVRAAQRLDKHYILPGKGASGFVKSISLDLLDKGLELREDFVAELRRSLATVEAGGETIPVQEVAKRLGLIW